MARIEIPYFVVKPGALRRDGLRARRFYWQPDARLAAQGWKSLRLADDETQAMAQARARNDQLAAWRDAGIAAAVAGAGGRPVALPPPGVRPAKGRPAPGSIDALIADYKASRFYAAKAATTRYDYDIHLRRIEQWAGGDPVRDIDAPDAQEFYDALRPASLSMANAVMRVARLLFQYGVRRGYRTDNPFAKPMLEALEDGGMIWPRRAVRDFAAQADAMDLPSIADAVLLAEWIGLRKMDLLRLPPSVLAEGGFSLRPAKTSRRTGRRAILRADMVPLLVERFRAAAERHKARGWAATTAIVCEATGRPWSGYHFTHRLAEIRAALAKRCPAYEQDDGIAGDETVATASLTFKQLRATAVTRLAEAGSTTIEIAAITGHSLRTIDAILDQHYLARTAPMAQQAMQRRLDADEKRRRKERG